MDGEYLNQNTAHSLKCGWWWCALVTFGRCWILCSSWMSNRVGLHLWQDVAHADCVRRPPAVCWDRINIHKWLYTLMHGSFHVMYSTAAQGPPSQNWKCYRSDWLPPSTTPSPPSLTSPLTSLRLHLFLCHGASSGSPFLMLHALKNRSCQIVLHKKK